MMNSFRIRRHIKHIHMIALKVKSCIVKIVVIFIFYKIKKASRFRKAFHIVLNILLEQAFHKLNTHHATHHGVVDRIKNMCCLVVHGFNYCAANISEKILNYQIYFYLRFISLSIYQYQQYFQQYIFYRNKCHFPSRFVKL